MAFLFEVIGKAVFPTAEALRITPYKEIWERDKKESKEDALEDFTYIEFMSSVKRSNPFRQYDEDKKEENIYKEVITRENWKPDELILAAISKLKDFQVNASSTYSYYMAAKSLAEKMKTFFMTVDIEERNLKTLNPIYKPKDITNVLNDTETVLNNLKSLEKKVEEEIYESSRMKAGKEISPFAKRSSMR